jgi:nitrogen fixation protein NifU and related proteins
MAYSEKVVDHYENPRNVGSFEKGDDSVGTGMVGAPACGDVMKLQIKVNPVTGIIEDARFKTYGCGSAIASSSLVTEWACENSLLYFGRRRYQSSSQRLQSQTRRGGCCCLTRNT